MQKIPNMSSASSSSSSSSMSNDIVVNDGDHWYNNIEPVFSINWIWTAIALSFTTFSLVNHLLFRLNWWRNYFRQTTGDHRQLINSLTKLQRQAIEEQEPYDQWKWRNIVVSLIHSLVSGLIALYLSHEHFWSRRSLLGATTNWTQSGADDTYRLAICFSIGYFLYDTLLSVSKLGTYPDRLEIIVHHLITTVTLLWVIMPGSKWQQFQIYCIFGLIIELSNVFIHIRSLVNIELGTVARTRMSTVNSLGAIVSIFMFRFYPLMRIWLDLFQNHRSNVPWLLPLASLPMLSFTLISIVILWRLVREDFLTKTAIDDDDDPPPVTPRPPRPLATRLENISATEIDPPLAGATFSPTTDAVDDDLRCDLCVKKHQ